MPHQAILDPRDVSIREHADHLLAVAFGHDSKLPLLVLDRLPVVDTLT
jgi:hypothetical protein